MADRSLPTLLAPFQPLMLPVFQVNQKAVSELEKLVAVQANAWTACTEFCLDRWKAAAEVTDLAGLEGFYRDQIEAATGLWKRMIDDGKTLVEMEAGFRAKMCEFVKEGVDNLGVATN
jgi:phasin family protein